MIPYIKTKHNITLWANRQVDLAFLPNKKFIVGLKPDLVNSNPSLLALIYYNSLIFLRSVMLL